MAKKKMSLETRNKISKAVKESHERKLDAQYEATSKSRRLMYKLGEAFAEGHPDGQSVAAIRNYGGFGIERRIEGLEDRKKANLPEHEEKVSSSQKVEDTQSNE